MLDEKKKIAAEIHTKNCNNSIPSSYGEKRRYLRPSARVTHLWHFLQGKCSNLNSQCFVSVLFYLFVIFIRKKE